MKKFLLLFLISISVSDIHTKAIAEDLLILYKQEVDRDPSNFEAQFNLGIEYFRQFNNPKAIEHLQRASELDSTNAPIYFNLGLVYLAQEKFEQAATAFSKAIQYRQSYTKAHNFLAQAYVKLEKFADAIINYKKVVELEPNNLDAWYALARAHRSAGQNADAIQTFQQLLQRDPKNINALFEVGYLYNTQGDYEQAVSYYQKLLALNPEVTDAECNMAHTMRYMGKFAQAIAPYEHVISKWPDFAHAHYGLAECYLITGDFKKGWQEWEWHWKRTPDVRKFADKYWDGSDLHNKTIILRAEYGHGDTFQFIRYAPLLKQQGAYVIVEAQSTLVQLLKLCPYIDKVITVNEKDPQLPAHDWQIPMMCLPRMFNTTLETIPTQIPYVYAAPYLVEQWKNKLKPDTNFKIGICWEGSPYYESFKAVQSRKAINLDTLAPLATIPGVSLYSLQKMNGIEQLKNVSFVHDFGPQFDNEHGRFMDTAAVIENLDLVITVDTSVAHLAGALGKPVWMLLPFVADWRWLLERNDSPWYPTMRIFRQKDVCNWAGVIDDVCAQLCQILPGNKNQSPTKPTTNPISISTEIAIGELLDKITILQIKMERIKDPKKLQNVRTELESLTNTYHNIIKPTPVLEKLTADLLEANKQLWDIEDEIRDKERNQQFDQEFVKLARSVYFTNDERCRVKREINNQLGSHIVEEKSYSDYTQKNKQ